MTDSIIQYDAMVQTALLSVVRDVLHNASKDGLPGEHHFYLTFSTTHPEVSIPAYLKERYPEEMTIVVQNQFADLVVDEAHFELSLSFSGKLEHLYIPFVALEGFFDPSVDFGLHFNASDPNNDHSDDLPAIVEAASDINPAADKPDDNDNNVVALDTFRKK